MSASSGARKVLEQKLLKAQLQQLNRLALQNEIITEEIYRKIEAAIHENNDISA